MISTLGVREIREEAGLGLCTDGDAGAVELGGSNSATISTHPDEPSEGFVQSVDPDPHAVNPAVVLPLVQLVIY